MFDPNNQRDRARRVSQDTTGFNGASPRDGFGSAANNNPNNNSNNNQQHTIETLLSQPDRTISPFYHDGNHWERSNISLDTQAAGAETSLHPVSQAPSHGYLQTSPHQTWSGDLPIHNPQLNANINFQWLDGEPSRAYSTQTGPEFFTTNQIGPRYGPETGGTAVHDNMRRPTPSVNMKAEDIDAIGPGVQRATSQTATMPIPSQHEVRMEPLLHPFLQSWIDYIMLPRQEYTFSQEHVDAFAILARVPPQQIEASLIGMFPFVETTPEPQGNPSDYIPPPPMQSPLGSSPVLRSNDARANFRRPDNSELEAIIAYVEKAKGKCLKPDNRQGANQGAYECTQKCGYRTERAADWKRHEENRQPQQIFVCCVCRNDERKTKLFITYRDDKFVGHITKTHKLEYNTEMLEQSRVRFGPSFERRCSRCLQEFRTWDERCEHIQNHLLQEQSLRSENDPTVQGV